MIWLQPNRLASAYRWYSKLPFDKYSKLCGDKFLRDRKKLHKIRSTWTVIFSNRFSLKPNLSIKSKTLDWKYSSHYIIAFFYTTKTLCAKNKYIAYAKPHHHHMDMPCENLFQKEYAKSAKIIICRIYWYDSVHGFLF